ncbi:hypothetical protein GS429_08615 [Natronorubrum sp. JWXQ-INN-674]|uniref:DUF7282 domain-containing protein n=1 Tax=Natronorubrum halalkaliphilum TaxID=2691917 RepID=A0A6B0VMX7_9EURY|nr:hypothetical protein [Natronorubrum halalkaliphilum]MXV62122.1 hypothetical protein [Natronorubrum halalkaliphilum]
MNWGRGAVATVAVAFVMVTSVMALPLLGGSIVPSDGSEEPDESLEDETVAAAESSDLGSADGSESETDVSDTGADVDGGEGLELISMGPTTETETDVETDTNTNTDADAEADVDVQASLSAQQQDAVEAGVDEGIELAQSQGVEVTQEQRAAAIEGASESVVQHQEAEVEQIQEATKGAVHGSLMQEQEVEIEQVQYAVSGATGGALSQYQTVSASQMQSATWGATHGAVAQEQRATVEQIQVATRGAAAGAASEAGDKDVTRAPKIQEAAQGAAYGVLEQYQKITVEQRQQITLEHVQHSAAGASAGALEGSTEAVLEQEQRVEVEQHQRVTVKQIQKAATGAAKGALVQKQAVTVEQTQSAARGAGKGSLKQVQTVSVEQVQRITITQIQEASFGAAKGSIYQSQEATVEQIQAAADGAAGGVLVQQQEVSITQIQHAAVGASQGSIQSAVQRQVVEVEQIQAAAFGAGEGAVIQKQVVDVTQVQKLATGGASGALIQYQEATVEQIQFAARGACQETARAVQYQRISVTQLQVLTQNAASDATAYAIQEGLDDIDDEAELSQFLEVEVSQQLEEIEELEGEAAIAFADQDSEGESVVVDSVDLSEGGFVAIYDGDTAAADPAGVIGVSNYLEAGAHDDVEIDLEEPIEDEQPLVAVAHHDTTGDETFQYAETDGEADDPYTTLGGSPIVDSAIVTVDDPDDPEPEATLDVTDQEGDGGTVTVDEASASVDYALTVTDEDDEQLAESEAFEANETTSGVELDLEPPLEENATLEVAVVSLAEQEEATEDALETESIEYTVEDDALDDPDEEEATLNVSDQTGDGETLTVDEANASVDYALTVTDEDDEQLAESETFEANESADLETLDLEPPLEENATLEVAVVAAEDGAAADGDTDAIDAAAGTSAADADADADNADVDGVLESETIEYTVDGDPETFDVEFVDCQQAEVTGSFEDGDMIIVATTFYESAGIGNTMGEYAVTVGDDVDAPFEGTITYEVGDEFTVDETDDEATVTVPEGDFGAAITGVASPDATPGEIDHPNPDGSECVEEIRPELPEISVEETEPTDTDAIEVTFGYENPNDAALFVDSDFVEGTTDDEPVDEFEPGTESFTVEWTPETDDERLVWEVGLSHYDYEEVLTAETATAGEIDPTDPAEFGVSITGTNDPVEQGELLEVDADIENVGGQEGTQDIELSIDGVSVDEAPISLEAGSTEAVTLTAETDNLEPGEHPVEVSSENETAETTVTIEEPGEPEFGVSITGTNDPVEQGEPLEVDADIENVGDQEGTQDIELSIGGASVDDVPVSLAPGATEVVSLTADTDDLEPGVYTAAVSSENETAETTVTIEADEPDVTETPEEEEEEADPFDEPAEEEEEADPFDEPDEEPPAEESPEDEPETEEGPTTEDESPAEEPPAEEEPPTEEEQEPAEPAEEPADDGDDPAETQSPDEPDGPGSDAEPDSEPVTE